MDCRDLQDFRAETAAHRLGQYNAWDISGFPGIDLVWVSKAHPENPAAHRILPHGEPSIAIRRQRDAKGDIAAIDLTVCGPYRRACFYAPAPSEELIGIRLKPEVAGLYFDVAPADFNDAPPLDAPRKLQRACSESLCAAETSDIPNIIPILIMDLLACANSRSERASPETHAASLLRQTGGRVTLKYLASEIGVSDRHIRRRFRDAFGITPKEYARQLRLTGAALEAEREAVPNWARIAAASGFHDQAHMVNEFQAMLGMTPRQLHCERRALLNTV